MMQIYQMMGIIILILLNRHINKSCRKHKRKLNEQNDNFTHNSHYILSNKVRTNAFSSPILAKNPSPKNISPLSSENIIDFQTRIGATPTFFEPIVYKCCEPFQLDS